MIECVFHCLHGRVAKVNHHSESIQFSKNQLQKTLKTNHKLKKNQNHKEIAKHFITLNLKNANITYILFKVCQV